MLNLSDDSIKKVGKCMTFPKDAPTLCKFMRTSYINNTIVVDGGLDRIPVGAVGFGYGSCNKKYGQHWYAEFGADIHSVYTPRDKPTLSEREITTHKLRSEPPLNTIVNRTIAKVKSANALVVSNWTLNSETLSIFKGRSHFFRKSSSVFLESCKVEWTSAELQVFLMIFDNLDSVMFFDTSIGHILADEHMLLLRGSFIKMEYVESLSILGITDKSCDHWRTSLKGLSPHYIHFVGLTHLHFSSINLFMEDVFKMFKSPGAIENLKKDELIYKFGTLKYSESQIRAIFEAQRTRGKQWTITTNDIGIYYTVIDEDVPKRCGFIFDLTK